MRVWHAGLLLVLLAAPQVATAADDAAAAAELEKTIAPLVQQGFSGCVLVERKGTVILRKGYGLADRTAQIPNAPEMRFDTGAITQSILSAAIMVEVKNGTLKLNSKLGDLLKNVPKDKQNITVEQLLSHTSGLSRSYTFPKGVDMTKRDPVIAALLKVKLARPPGGKHEYSNANCFLLAAILDTVDKRGYEQTLRETVFEPLKMPTAGFTADPLLSGEKSPMRYDNEVPKGTMVAWYHSWGHRGATGIACNVDELAAFTKALTPAGPFDAKEREEWLKVRDDNFALGWSVLEQPGSPKVILQGGLSIGSKSMLAYYPDSDTTLVVLMNSTKPGNLDEWTILRAVADNVAR